MTAAPITSVNRFVNKIKQIIQVVTGFIDSIIAIARHEPGVAGANGALTVHLSPDQIVVALSLEFSDSLTTPEIEEKVTALERGIRQAFPDVIAIFVKPQTLGTYQSARLRRREPAV